jgi:hypothetical protein
LGSFYIVTDMSMTESVFISYAWGGDLARKEWLRDQVVRHLDLYGFTIFWDRDSILFGQSIDDVIREALSVRPLNIVCICDADYIVGAKRANSGLFRELAMIAEMSGDRSVRILPVILDDGCADALPGALNGRMYLDLTKLHRRRLELGTALGSALLGAPQTQVAQLIDRQLGIAGMWARARAYFGNGRAGFSGNARTHIVKSNDGALLLPPAWMHEVIRWSNRIADDVPGFCPAKGIWHWDHWTPSTGMRALGAAAMSAFFPEKTSDEDIGAIEFCGDALAVRILAMTKKTEHLQFDWKETIQCVIASDGMRALDRLLPRLDPDA